MSEIPLVCITLHGHLEKRHIHVPVIVPIQAVKAAAEARRVECTYPGAAETTADAISAVMVLRIGSRFVGSSTIASDRPLKFC